MHVIVNQCSERLCISEDKEKKLPIKEQGILADFWCGVGTGWVSNCCVILQWESGYERWEESVTSGARFDSHWEE